MKKLRALFAVLCFGLCRPRLPIKLGVFVSREHWNSTAIKNAVSQRININLKLVKHIELHYVKYMTEGNASNQDTQNVCQQKNLAGVISVGECDTIQNIDRLAAALQLPHLAVPQSLCELSYSEFSVQVQMSWRSFVRATVAVAHSNHARRVVVYFDTSQDNRVVKYLHEELSSSLEKSISAQFYRIDHNVIAVNGLFKHMADHVKQRIYNVIVLASPKVVFQILRQGERAKILQQNYFWSIIDTGIKTAELETFARSQLHRIVGDQNILLIRSGGMGIFSKNNCATFAKNIFPKCNQSDVKSLDVRTVDAMEAFSVAVNNAFQQTQWSVSYNYSCQPLRVFDRGKDIINEVKKLKNFDTTRAIYVYNASTNVLETADVIYTATETLWNRSPPTQFRYVGRWNPNQGLTKVFRNIFPNKFEGWKNETLQLCSSEILPFVIYLNETYTNGKRRFNGMLVDILNYLSHKMAFRYEVQEAYDKQWGAPLWNGSKHFSGCVGELQNGTMDMGASTFTVSATRDTVIDFTVPLFEEANAVLLALPKPLSKMWNVFLPFSWHLWINVIVAIVVTAGFAHLLSKFSPMSAWNRRLPWAITDEVWFKEYVWSVWSSFAQQGQDFYPYAISSRSVIAFWWLFTLVVLGTYTGDLTAHLAVTVVRFPIKNLEDLAAQTSIRPLVPRGTNIDTLLAFSKDKTYRTLHSRKVSADTINSCTKMVLTNPDRACMTDYTAVLYMARKYCNALYMAPHLFNTAAVSFITPEDSYYKELLDFYIKKLHESGNMKRWFNKYWTFEKVCSKFATAEAHPITLEGVGGTYVLTLSLYGTSLVILLLELFWIRYGSQFPKLFRIFEREQ